MTDWIERQLDTHLRPPEGVAAPDFASTLEAAALRAGRPGQQRIVAGLAACGALVALAVLLRPGPPDADPYRIDEALMTSTYWSAPSDTLLPERRFDIYQEVPALPGSTESTEGTFL